VYAGVLYAPSVNENEMHRDSKGLVTRCVTRPFLIF
jgi:hypothetical protein